MFQLRLIALCWAFLFSAVIAAPPVPVIKTSVEPETEIVPGDIIAFDASETIEATGYKWAVLPAKFADNKPTHEVSLDGKSLRLASRPGSYVIILAITNKESEIALIKRDVVVGKVVPGPSPGPVGPIGPDPVVPKPLVPSFPNDSFSISLPAYNAAVALTDYRGKHKALSLAFRQIGGAAAAGGFNSLKEIELASIEANRKAICGTTDPASTEGVAIRNGYLPFFKAIQPLIAANIQDKAALPANYGKMLIAIADGLAAASEAK